MTTFSINRRTLQTELTALLTVAETKNTIPVLATTLFCFDGSVLRLTATDLEVTMETQIAGQGDAWSGCVPLRQLTSLVKLLEGDEVQFTLKDNRIEVKSGKSRHMLPLYDLDAFPAAIQAQGESWSVNGDELRLGLRLVLPFVTLQESRYTLQGVNFERKRSTLNLVATDCHRLGFTTIPANCKEGATIIPYDALKSLLTFNGKSFAITIDDNHATFQCDHRTLTTRLLTGTFPNWEMIMPKDQPHWIQCETKELIAVLRRTGVTRDETYKVGVGSMRGGVKWTVGADSLTIETPENDKGYSSESLAITSNLNGESVEIGLDPDYVMDMLVNAPERVKCEFKDGNSQLLFTWDESQFKYVLMPRRL